MTDCRNLPTLLSLFILLTFLGVSYILLNLSYKDSSTDLSSQTFFWSLRNDNVAEQQTETIAEQHNIAPLNTSNITIVSKPRYKFMVFIITAPDHFQHRSVLRDKSWLGYQWTDKDGQSLDHEWRHVFVVGRSESVKRTEELEEEAATYGDLVIAENLDSYHNLVLKVLWMLEYSTGHYDFDYLVKADDDTFINIQLLDKFITGLNHEKMFFGGVRMANSPVFRTGRYGVSKELWGPDVYAPYCSGSGYVLGYDSVIELVRVFKSGVQPVFYVEDAFMGALAFHSAVVKPQHIQKFYWHQKYGCKDTGAILMHYVKLEMLSEFMEKYKEGEPYCSGIVAAIKSKL